MSELITDEIREAAADAVLEAIYGQELPEAPIDLVRAALEAAAPLIAARALEEAAEALEVVPDHTASPYDQGRVDQRHADAFDLHERAARQKEARA